MPLREIFETPFAIEQGVVGGGDPHQGRMRSLSLGGCAYEAFQRNPELSVKPADHF
jgi:hypothetical protein